MPIPANFDNTVVLFADSILTPAYINGVLTDWNNDGYWLTSFEFVNAANALGLFVKYDTIYANAESMRQKMNAVDYDQAALDADKAAEIANGWWPTGIFIRPIGDEIEILPLILYQRLDPPLT